MQLHNGDNTTIKLKSLSDLIYADMIYENEDLSWIKYYWDNLKPNGIFIVQTDWHTNYLVRYYFEKSNLISGAVFVNDLVWKNEWGNFPKNKMHQCYDNIIIYAKGNNYKFYPERIQIPKVTKTHKLNPSGRDTKMATAWIDDICLTTTSLERIKLEDGHLIRWQKPLRLFDRIVPPFTDEGDLIVDPFMGSGTLGVWCKKNNREYIGIENDQIVFNIAQSRIVNIK